MRSARTNGAIFLALPANGPERNAINQDSSLLRAICRSDDATECRGPAAAQAEFRTNRGTWARVGGLLLIVAGSLGALLLLGFLALRLLTAAVFSLLYLMLAPAAVLAPMLGDSGRAVFRKWAAQLLGAVVSKLLFSFLLGAMLAILGILASLEALGWWTQWLLMSAFWWGAFLRRHQTLHVGGEAIGRERVLGGRRSVARRVGEALDPPRKLIGDVRAARARFSKRAPNLAEHAATERVPAGRGAVAHEQAERTLAADYRAARTHTRDAPRIERRVDVLRSRLERIDAERGRALASGDARRAARLGVRGARIEGEIDRERRDLGAARQVLSGGEHAGRGVMFGPAQAEQRDRFLDEQAALPPANRRLERHGGHGERGSRSATGERRDYAALSGLAGYANRQYERLTPREQRAARAEIDKELALRRERLQLGGQSAGRSGGEREGGRAPRLAAERPARPWRAEGRSARPDRATASESSVMRDAREVAARRKRQLGHGRR